ncbi:uncharacterized protein LOC119974400 [Scyliorhinus canicula]|uniref:uncharacterized protein LOC119974400 n=1 Tax=Scyliorhinus canicula TaxID=7830 RepID=UPI0018F7C808|nr:uncharacterized protein LOC119974400 [Scyliorhinus canicula]
MARRKQPHKKCQQKGTRGVKWRKGPRAAGGRDGRPKRRRGSGHPGERGRPTKEVAAMKEAIMIEIQVAVTGEGHHAKDNRRAGEECGGTGKDNPRPGENLDRPEGQDCRPGSRGEKVGGGPGELKGESRAPRKSVPTTEYSDCGHARRHQGQRSDGPRRPNAGQPDRERPLPQPPELNRAHGLLRTKPKAREQPKVITAKQHQYQNREKILRWARQT